MNYRSVLKQFLPPVLVNVANRSLRAPCEWEYKPDGWSAKYERVGGWNDCSIAETQRARWPVFVQSLKGTAPLTSTHTYVSPELTTHSLNAHNIAMCYGYVIALAARKKHEISVLDWGGGVGHYYLISKALLPNIRIQYSIYDKPLLCQAGRELLPEVDFYENPDDALEKKYDLVFVSNSLQYFENWQEIAGKLARSTQNYLYITQLPVIHKAKSFVTIQKAYQEKNYGYDSEFCGWILNRQEFAKCVEQSKMYLVREFLLGAGPSVLGAPEQNEYLGFLFIPCYENNQADSLILM
jgi:putative methyltransferase (TIGR04325 family)